MGNMKLNGDLPNLALFDLDGVLIKPGGYRAAVKATINHFSQAMRMGDQAPEESDIALLEAYGVTSEWDMVPIFVAILLDNVAEVQQEPLPDCSLKEILAEVARRGSWVKNDYRPKIQDVVQYLVPGIPASEAVLAGVEEGKTLKCLGGKTFVRELLRRTRNVKASYPTRIFQTYILGSAGFKKNYGLKPGFISQSLLEQNDRSLLSQDDITFLQDLIAGELIKASVITARPSLPPVNGNRDDDYSPEAEMALALTGLDHLRIIGYGTMQYLARKLGVMPDSLVKPSPVQALAAIAAAFGQDVTSALDWSAGVCGFSSNHKQAVDLPGRFTIHIFEDSSIGIQACLQAARLLGNSGVAVDVKAWGIATNVDKVHALTSAGAAIFEDIHGAIQAAFRE